MKKLNYEAPKMERVEMETEAAVMIISGMSNPGGSGVNSGWDG